MIDVWHVAIPVRDLKESVRFYVKGLGFELLGFSQEGVRSQAFVRLPARSFTIELFEAQDGTEKLLSAKPHHLAFDCENLELVRSNIEGRGLIKDLPQIRTFENGVKYLGLSDPDAVSLEFFQGRKIFDQSIAATALNFEL